MGLLKYINLVHLLVLPISSLVLLLGLAIWWFHLVITLNSFLIILLKWHLMKQNQFASFLDPSY